MISLSAHLELGSAAPARVAGGFPELARAGEPFDFSGPRCPGIRWIRLVGPGKWDGRFLNSAVVPRRRRQRTPPVPGPAPTWALRPRHPRFTP